MLDPPKLMVVANLAVEPSFSETMNTVLLREASGVQLTTKVGSEHVEQSSESHWFRLHHDRDMQILD